MQRREGHSRFHWHGRRRRPDVHVGRRRRNRGAGRGGRPFRRRRPWDRTGSGRTGRLKAGGRPRANESGGWVWGCLGTAGVPERGTVMAKGEEQDEQDGRADGAPVAKASRRPVEGASVGYLRALIGVAGGCSAASVLVAPPSTAHATTTRDADAHWAMATTPRSLILCVGLVAGAAAVQAGWARCWTMRRPDGWLMRRVACASMRH